VLSEERLRDLLVSGLSGDSQAYHAFLTQIGEFLRTYLRRRLRNMPQEVEDLLQEILLSIHNQRHTFDPTRPLTPWVYAIARYKLIDRLRRRSRTDDLHEPVDDEKQYLVNTDHEAAEAECDLGVLLRLLPDRQRLPIQYVKIEGASVAETASRTGMSVSAVKVGIHRGLKALAAKIRSSG
jgi:RNA polymerase sigma-70 factor, ECF subfamily